MITTISQVGDWTLSCIAVTIQTKTETAKHNTIHDFERLYLKWVGWQGPILVRIS